MARDNEYGIPRPIRPGDERWARFGAATSAVGTDRSKTVREFMDLYTDLGPDLWVRFAAVTGERRSDVLRAFMAWYLGAPDAELPVRRPA